MGRENSAQRQAILAAAITVFAERGRRGATIRLVGRRAGVNSALIYYYFENKETLFAEAIRHVLRGFLEHLGAWRQAFRGARDRLAWLVDGLFDYYSAHPDRMRLMAVVLTLQPELLGRTLNKFLPGRVLIPLEVLAEGVRRGELRPAHPLECWWSILSLCLFSLLFQPVLRQFRPPGLAVPPAGLAARREQILDLLERGLARPRSPAAARRKRSSPRNGTPAPDTGRTSGPRAKQLVQPEGERL
ncbi:MAG: TetR/AcrR family transcriptional regulator [Kiritimatiellaeota bacterium]|nr:TetR/AcrR family transcriptional regulator [Kiritimatiellota bacterium]